MFEILFYSRGTPILLQGSRKLLSWNPPSEPCQKVQFRAINGNGPKWNFNQLLLPDIIHLSTYVNNILPMLTDKLWCPRPDVHQRGLRQGSHRQVFGTLPSS